MAGESAAVQDSGGEELDESVARGIGAVAGAMNFVALTAVSYFLFDTNWLVFGVVVGLCSAAGSFLFLPWILQNQDTDASETAETEFSTEGTAADHEESGGIHPVALGFGLEAAGIGMLAGRIGLEDLLFGVGVGIAVGLGAFLVASIAFQYGAVE